MSDMLSTWLFVCWGAVTCRGIQTDQISVSDATSNWWDAHSRCSLEEGNMYTPGSDDIPPDILGRLQPNTYYWIGAMAYSAWIWTEDGSPLYKYAGFLPLHNVTYTWTVDYLDNSVWKCHLYCSSYSSMGMQGKTCYCLHEEYKTVNSSTTENRCPGNFDELCGNVDGISVYKLEDISFTQQRGGRCAYVELHYADLTTYSSSYRDCKGDSRRYACYADDRNSDDCGGSGCVSLSSIRKSWTGANRYCYLVTLTTPVQNNLLRIMPRNRIYWIGLYKRVHRKWINVKESTTSTKVAPTSSSSSYPSSASTVSEDVSTVPGSPSSNRSSPAGTSDAKKTPYNPQTDAGGYIGLGVGSVVLVVLAGLIIVFLLRRQKKLCFETKVGNQPIHFTSAAESTYCGLAPHTQTEDGTYSVITHPDTTDGATAMVQPNTHSDNTYINTPQINDEAEIQEA